MHSNYIKILIIVYAYFNLLVQIHKSITIINPEIISCFVLLIDPIEGEIVHLDPTVLISELVLNVVFEGSPDDLLVGEQVGRHLGRHEVVPEVVVRQLDLIGLNKLLRVRGR